MSIFEPKNHQMNPQVGDLLDFADPRNQSLIVILTIQFAGWQQY